MKTIKIISNRLLRRKLKPMHDNIVHILQFINRYVKYVPIPKKVLYIHATMEVCNWTNKNIIIYCNTKLHINLKILNLYLQNH